jgi:prepilin-type N-terminal cleavage/methylation domain-containing protein
MRKIFTVDPGFTLIELLVVISIIGILIGLSIFGLQGARQSSRDAKRKADLELIRSGLEIYKADCGAYPSSLSFGSSLVGGLTCPNTYISSVPQDPQFPVRNYYYSPDGKGGYVLCAALESGSGSVSGCGGSCGQTCNYQVTSP